MKRQTTPWTQVVVAVAALAGLAGAGASMHARATLAETGQRLSLLERQDAVLGDKLAQEQVYRKAVLAKLDALCRALPQANCPLGENER